MEKLTKRYNVVIQTLKTLKEELQKTRGQRHRAYNKFHGNLPMTPLSPDVPPQELKKDKHEFDRLDKKCQKQQTMISKIKGNNIYEKNQTKI